MLKKIPSSAPVVLLLCIFLLLSNGYAAGSSLFGTWEFRTDKGDYYLVLSPEGEYFFRIQFSGGQESEKGAYYYENGIMTIWPDSGGEIQARTRFNGRDLLEIRLPCEDGRENILNMRRVGGTSGYTGDAVQGGAAYSSGGGKEVRSSGRNNASGNGPGTTLLLRRYQDRTENAFSILIPDGWLTSGGMIRINPTAAGGPSQSIEAKLDFGVYSDERGTVAMRWLPHIYYTSMQGSPAAQMGLYPQGSQYMGMTVMPQLTPVEFAEKIVFPYIRPKAEGARLVEQKNLPRLSGALQKAFDQSPLAFMGVKYSAGLAGFEYKENGRIFLEKVLVIIENRGVWTMGQWCNRFTLAVRAPRNEFAVWEPVWRMISDSSRLNPNWAAQEVRGMAQRGEIVLKTQRQIQEIGRSIAEHRSRMNSEINNDMYLNLTGQEEYVNPYTGEVETGTDSWKHRWENNLGEVLYTDDPSYDPNTDPNANLSGFRPSRVRPRFGG